MSHVLTPGTQVGGRYRVVRQIGKGGMGAVYEATDERFGSPVALKQMFLNPNLAPQQVSQVENAFRREAVTLNHLDHPALPKVTDYFVEPEGHFLAMSFIKGHDLAAWLEQRIQTIGRPFSEDEVIPWMLQVLSALEYLHNQNPPVIHRDIKPHNIKVTAQGKVYLLDFGISKGIAGQYTVTGSGHSSIYAYTLGYASLEQIQGTGTDARSDLYSLGATMYHLLTGSPMDREPRRDALTRASQLAIGNPDPLVLPPTLSPAMRTILAKSLSLNANHRPQTAKEFARALEGVLQPQHPAPVTGPTIPVPPQSPSPTQPPRHFHYDPPKETVPPIPPHTPSPPVPRSTPAPVAQPRGKGLGWLVLVAVLAVVLIGVGGVGLWFARDGDGMTTLPPAMVKIDGGTFVIGKRSDERGDDDENNKQPVTVGSFAIGRYEITNAQYKLFMDDGGYDAGKSWWDDAGRGWLQGANVQEPRCWGDEDFGIAHLNRPVVCISWYEAVAFCRWLTQHMNDGYIYRLPTEAEWEYAARRDTRRIYPWGNEEPDGERANYVYDGSPGMTTAVGSFLKGVTPDGIYDMAGNVWEWTSSIFKDYPYDPNDGREDLNNPASSSFVIRGGGWDSPSDSLRASYRDYFTPAYHFNYIGFRLARHLP